MKNSFIFYYEYKQHLQLLNDKELGQLMRAIIGYEIDGVEPVIISGKVQMAYSFMKSNLDRDRVKYDTKCTRNSENGKRGGRPVKSETEEETAEPNETERLLQEPKKSERLISKPKKADNDNDNDKDKDKDNVKERESTVPSGTRSPARKKYGAYENVKLSDDDLGKLQVEFPDWQERIERLSEYIAAKGDKYKCHIAVIRSWAKKDAGEPPGAVQKVYAPQYNSNPFLQMLKDEGAI